MVWLVRMADTPGGELHWLQATPDGGGEGRGTADEFAAVLQASPRRLPVVLLLPAAMALVAAVRTPVRNPRQLQQALPFLVEELLATDVELMHIVPGARLADGRLQVVAVARSLMTRLLDNLRVAGIDPDIVTVDGLLLPLPASGATLWLDARDSLLASREGTVVGAQASDAATLTGMLALPADSVLEIHVGDAGAVTHAAAAVAEEGDEGVRTLLHEQPQSLLALLSTNLSSRLAQVPNLRQGPFARSTDGSFDPGFNWRPLAWLAACWALVAFAYQVALGIAHSRAADALRDEQVALYRQLFPGASQVPDPRKQMQGRIGAAGGGSPAFTQLVAEAAAALGALDAAGDRYKVSSMGWEQAQGQLRLDVVARSFEDIEQLRRKLEQRGLQVDVGAGVSQEGGYKARINLEAGA